MTIAETVKAVLNDEYHKRGMKQREIAKAHNVSRSYIQSLLTGRCPFEGITLDSLSKMFPRATLNLNGDGSIMQTVAHVSAKNGSVNNISLNPAAPSEAQIRLAVDAFRHDVIDALIGLDIPPDALASVLKTIKELAP